MPLIKVDFEPDISHNQITKKIDFVYRPYAFVTLGKGKKWLPNFMKALIDSGADNNTFPAAEARALGLGLTKGEKRRIKGVGGDTFFAYGHQVKLKVGEKEIETVIYFGEEVTVPLLGREGFFNYFKRVSFKQKEKITELKY